MAGGRYPAFFPTEALGCRLLTCTGKNYRTQYPSVVSSVRVGFQPWLGISLHMAEGTSFLGTPAPSEGSHCSVEFCALQGRSLSFILLETGRSGVSYAGQVSRLLI